MYLNAESRGIRPRVDVCREVIVERVLGEVEGGNERVKGEVVDLCIGDGSRQGARAIDGEQGLTPAGFVNGNDPVVRHGKNSEESLNGARCERKIAREGDNPFGRVFEFCHASGERSGWSGESRLFDGLECAGNIDRADGDNSAR